MTIKPRRPDLDDLRNNAQFAEETGNFVDINSNCIIWMIDMLKEAEKLAEIAADNWIMPFFANNWLRKYRGESDGD